MTEDQIRYVPRPKRLEMRPATLHEKLERVRQEIAKMDENIQGYKYPGDKQVSAQELYDHLKLREKVLLAEIEMVKLSWLRELERENKELKGSANGI